MTSTELFQKRHGADWGAIVTRPAFSAALLHVNSDVVQAITVLTDEEIDTHGKIILSDLRGALRHEAKLIELSVIHPELINDLPQSTYPSPEEEAAEEADQAQGGGESMRMWGAEIAADILSAEIQQPTEPPKPKRGRKKKTDV